MERFLFQRSHPTDPKRFATKAEEKKYFCTTCLCSKKIVYDHRQVWDCGEKQILIRYEIVVILEGVIEQTGNTIQVSSISLKFFLDLTDRTSVSRISKYDNDISLSVQFFPRRAPLTSPTRCCGVTASSTYSTSSIPSPSTKSTIHHSTQSTSKKSLHKLGDLFTESGPCLTPTHPPTHIKNI